MQIKENIMYLCRKIMGKNKVRGFKAMNPDMTCRGFQFELGKTFLHEGKIEPCQSGFHFCEKIEDVLYFYDQTARMFEVEADRIVTKENTKTVTNHLTILKEIDYSQYIDSTNTELRALVANKGIGLDILINDPDWKVRREVAKHGFGLDVLINDQDFMVRCEVAKQGYGLDILINDEQSIVRSIVLSTLNNGK